MTIKTRQRMLAVIAAAVGTVVFILLGLPLPLLLGPMAGCLVFALAGAPLEGPGWVGTFMRTFLGVAIGTAITPQMGKDLPVYGPSLLLVPVIVLIIGCVGYPLFRRVFGYDKTTAFYAAMPGGLQDMLIFGEEAGGNVRAMSLIHATRVLILVSFAPVFLTLVYGLDLDGPPGAPAISLPWSQLALMVTAALVGWLGAVRVGLFGASILGPMIVAAILTLSGVLNTRPPAEVIWAAQFVIGLAVGAKYTGISGPELRRDVGAGVLLSIVLGVISLGMIELVILVSDAPTLDIILAFIPGGQAEMAIIALVAGADVAFVVAHHLLRIVLIIATAPYFFRILR